MINDAYRNSFKEVFIILQNTEEELVRRIPKGFINFLEENMNPNYSANINTDLKIDKQILLPETEDILSLIYRSYWATDEEKVFFYNQDKQYEENMKNQYKDINQIFESKKNLSNITLDNNLAIIPKENFIHKFLKKILKIFHRKIQ